LEQLKSEKVLESWKECSGEWITSDAYLETVYTVYNDIIGRPGSFRKHNWKSVRASSRGIICTSATWMKLASSNTARSSGGVALGALALGALMTPTGQGWGDAGVL